MIAVRKAQDRGMFDFGWLRTAHSFSFGEYHDPAHMGFSVLRVMNDDVVAGGQGFGEHPHRDMEIITVVLKGALRHKDSSGGGGVIRPGDVQRMSAGKGVYHSEFNDSATEDAHLYQVWIRPAVRGVEPRYEQRHYAEETRRNQMRLVISPDGRDGSIPIHQDASLCLSTLDAGKSVRHTLAAGRKGWVQVASGSVTVNGVALGEGDGAAVDGEAALEIVAQQTAQVMVFDLP